MFYDRHWRRGRASTPFRRALVAAVTLAALAGHASPADALVRFSATLRGGVRVTGNALGLSGGDGRNAPGLDGSLSTFMGDPGSRDGGFPDGTTDAWTENASTAQLALPEGARVVYAELTWGASWSGGGATVAGELDDAVRLTTSTGEIAVSPDPDASVTFDERAAGGFLVRYYVRSADVTAFVQRAGPGSYTVRGVPAVQAANVSELNAGGWTLAVAYYDPLDAMRNITISSHPTWVDESQTLDIQLAGFCAPSTGEVVGQLALWAMEGDAHLTGDRVSIDAPAGAVPIQSTANPAENFFGAQLVARGGVRDLSGQHGGRNHEPTRGLNIEGGRQGWDLAQTTLTSAAGQLRNGQRSARFIVETTDDSLLIVGSAFEVEMQAPLLTLASEWIASDDESHGGTALAIRLINDGAAPASDVVLTVAGVDALELATVDSRPADVQTEASSAFIAVGSLDVAQERTVVLYPRLATFEGVLSASFAWSPCAGEHFVGEQSEELTVTQRPASVDGDAGHSDAGSEDLDAGAEPEHEGDAADTEGQAQEGDAPMDAAANESDADGGEAPDVPAPDALPGDTPTDGTRDSDASDASPTAPLEAPSRRVVPEDEDEADGAGCYIAGGAAPVWQVFMTLWVLGFRRCRRRPSSARPARHPAAAG